ncbi:hypothetical protein KHQ81_02405 [Mycoplasmatota bacterium]|nr:hypothetical protein KHQ81_02405 [Mycoplasmatota bacterium]
MKKLFISLLIGSLFLTGGLSVSANQESTTETQDSENNSEIKIEIEAGINPDSPIYFLDRGFENIRLWLTKDEAKKADLLLKFAEERMSELNDLPEDKVTKYVDKLLDDYSDKINQANKKMNTLIFKNKISEKTKLKLHDRLNHTVDTDEALKNKVKEKISTEIKAKISEIKNKTYLTAIASGLTNDEIDALKEQGYGYGEILKLNCISTITGKTIEDLKMLDIYNDLGEIDFSKLATELYITEEEVMTQIKEYRDTVRDEMRTRIIDMIQDRKDEIKEQVQQRREEIQNRVKENINNRLEERKNEIIVLINNKTTLHLEVLDILVEQEFISIEDKETIVSQVNDMKEAIITKIEENELNRNDYEQMKLEITKYIKTELQDKLVSIDLSLIDTSQLSEETIEVISCLLGNPQETVNVTIDKVIQRLQFIGITLTDEQIEIIQTRINEQIENGEFDIEEYDEILKQITDVIKEELGKEHADLFDNLNQYKDRYQERSHQHKDDHEFIIEQEVIDLFNNVVSELDLEIWNRLSVERQEMIRHMILSDIDLDASIDEMKTEIMNHLLNKIGQFNQHHR